MENTVVAMFKSRCAAVSTTVVEAGDLTDAMVYALELCAEKAPYHPLFTTEKSEKSAESAQKEMKTLAAPGLSEERFDEFTDLAKSRGIALIKTGLRGRMAGLEMGFGLADIGIAETGTCVLACRDEDVRLTSMICETHVLTIPRSRLVKTSYDAETDLERFMEQTMYTAFISGCSRTSDIERVLTLGVHGPLELHIVLTEV